MKSDVVEEVRSIQIIRLSRNGVDIQKHFQKQLGKLEGSVVGEKIVFLVLYLKTAAGVSHV